LFLGEHPEVLGGLEEVSRHVFSLVHVKSTSGSNRQPFVNTALDAKQLLSLRQLLMPGSFGSFGSGHRFPGSAGAFDKARQQITLLMLVVAAQDSSNATALLTMPRGKNVLEALRQGLTSLADENNTEFGAESSSSAATSCSANTLRLVMNFLSEFRVSLIKVLASGLMRGRGSHSRFHQHAMSAQQACMALLGFPCAGSQFLKREPLTGGMLLLC